MPFGPTMPTRSPAATDRDTPSSTWTAAKLFETARAASDPGMGGSSFDGKGEKDAVSG